MERANYTETHLTQDSKRAELRTDAWYVWVVKKITAELSKAGNPMLVAKLHPLRVPTDGNSAHWLNVTNYMVIQSPLTKKDKDEDKSARYNELQIGQVIPRGYSFEPFIQALFDDDPTLLYPKWDGPILKWGKEVLGERTDEVTAKALVQKELDTKKIMHQNLLDKVWRMYNDQKEREMAIGRVLFGKLVPDKNGGNFPKIDPMRGALPEGVKLLPEADFVV